MREWREQHRDDSGGWWDSIGDTVGDLMAAADAGAFAVSEDTGNLIIQRLTEVQAQINEMQQVGGFAAMNQQLGGGYAKDIATFNRQVTDQGLAQTLQQFSAELEQIKAAVQKSIAHYGVTDAASSQNVNRSGGGL